MRRALFLFTLLVLVLSACSDELYRGQEYEVEEHIELVIRPKGESEKYISPIVYASALEAGRYLDIDNSDFKILSQQMRWNVGTVLWSTSNYLYSAQGINIYVKLKLEVKDDAFGSGKIKVQIPKLSGVLKQLDAKASVVSSHRLDGNAIEVHSYNIRSRKLYTEVVNGLKCLGLIVAAIIFLAILASD